jgi:hypothetical protein
MTALDQAILLKKTGREYGPDIALKVIIPDADLTAAKALRIDTYPIKDDSSITEVLNVIAFLCNENRGTADSASIETTMSIADDGVYGLHVVGTGLYEITGLNGTTAASSGALTATAGTLYGGLASVAKPFNLAALTKGTNLAAPVIFPQGLMKRAGDADAGTKLYTLQGAHPIRDADVTPLMSNAILQAIHILERTREILGPKGWTDLFKKIKGGAKQNKHQRTHRHRRRYSSKQY